MNRSETAEYAPRRFWLAATPLDELFSVADTARALNVGRNKLRELGIPPRMVGRQKCYRKGDVLAHLQSPANMKAYIESRHAQRASWIRRNGARWREGVERADRLKHGASSPGVGPDWDAAELAAQEKAEADVAAAKVANPNLTLDAEMDLYLPAWNRYFKAEIARRGLLSGAARRGPK